MGSEDFDASDRGASGEVYGGLGCCSVMAAADAGLVGLSYRVRRVVAPYVGSLSNDLAPPSPLRVPMVLLGSGPLPL